MKQIKNILVIRLSSMGDIILTSPVIRQLKSLYPDSKIDFVLSSQFSEIYEKNPYINYLYQYNKSQSNSEIQKEKLEFLEQKSLKKYDLIIDLQRNLRSMMFRKGIYKRLFKYRKNRFRKLALVKFKWNKYDNIIQIPEVYKESIYKLGGKDDQQGLEIWLEKDQQEGKYSPGIYKENNDKLRIAIAPGAFHFTKRWPVEKFIELINIHLSNEERYELILIGGKSDQELCDEIIRNCDREILNKSGASSIHASAELIDSCDLLISNDTGVMHIAAARQTPTISLWGSTVKEFGFTPYRVKNIMLEVNLACRPCTHIGQAKCPLGHFNCLNKIEVKQVANAIEIILNS